MPVSSRDVARLRRDAALADAAGCLTPGQRALIHRRGWLKLLAPQLLGGAEMPLPQMVRLEEELAQADGSAAWVVTLCAGAGYFAGFLEPGLARDILATPRVCLGGSGAVGGTAEREGQGWRLQGVWPHASGAPLCTHFTLNARLQAGGQALLDDQGQPRVRAFVLPAAQARLLDTWHSMGLRASASQGFAVDGAWVDERQAFDIHAAAATSPGPLYRFPFMPLAHATLTANLSGLACEFLRLAEPALARPSARHLQGELERASGALQAQRARFYAALDVAWQSEDRADAEALVDAAQQLAAQARRSVQVIYPLCGLQAADGREALNRVWRDFHTASQHAIWLPAAKMQA